MIGEVGKIVRVERRTLGQWKEGGKSGKESCENAGSASVGNSGGVAERWNSGLSSSGGEGKFGSSAGNLGKGSRTEFRERGDGN